MIAIKKHGIILSKSKLLFENNSVLNPAIFQDGNTIHMLYRAVQKDNFSSIGYARLEGGLKLSTRNITPLLYPLVNEESFNLEDPRIVQIDGVFYITYTAFDGINALGSLITSTNLETFERHGYLVPKITFDEFYRLAGCSNLVSVKYFRDHRHFSPKKQVYLWNKNLVFFPRKIEGKFAFLMRIRPGIQLVMVNELHELSNEFWNNYFLHFYQHIVLDPNENLHESAYIGAGAPPIETKLGWLLIYHAVYDSPKGYIYTATAALLNLKNPQIVIARLKKPLFEPEFDYETNGVVNNVVFPTGTALFNDTLFIYYGAADQHIAVASVSMKKLLHELMLNKVSYDTTTNISE